MMAIAMLMPIAVAGIHRYMQIRKPWGGFCTFDAIGYRASLLQATSIGIFIVKE